MTNLILRGKLSAFGVDFTFLEYSVNKGHSTFFWIQEPLFSTTWPSMTSGGSVVAVSNLQTAVSEVIAISGSGLGIVWRGMAWCSSPVSDALTLLWDDHHQYWVAPAPRNLYSPAAGMMGELF